MITRPSFALKRDPAHSLVTGCAAAKTKRSVRRVPLNEELVDLLRSRQSLRVEPTTPLFTPGRHAG
jgi:hypothetical protein